MLRQKLIKARFLDNPHRVTVVGGVLRTSTRLTFNLLLLLLLRASACALTRNVSHAPSSVECLFCLNPNPQTLNPKH